MEDGRGAGGLGLFLTPPVLVVSVSGMGTLCNVLVMSARSREVVSLLLEAISVLSGWSSNDISENLTQKLPRAKTSR